MTAALAVIGAVILIVATDVLVTVAILSGTR